MSEFTAPIDDSKLSAEDRVDIPIDDNDQNEFKKQKYNSTVESENHVNCDQCLDPPEEGSESPGPQSSADNLIPLKKLQNGWMATMGFLTAAAINAKDKAATQLKEFNDREDVKNFKQKTHEKAAEYYSIAQPKATEYFERARAVSATAFDKSKEVAVPVWSKTCEVATAAVKKYNEVAETTIKPAVEKGMETVEKGVETITPVVEKGIENLRPVAEKVQAAIVVGTEKIMNLAGTGDKREPYAPSALDSATKGGPMNV